MLQHGKTRVEMACHPSGITFDVVGIRASSNGRSCENHECCGAVLEEDMVIRIREEQVMIDGKEQKVLYGSIQKYDLPVSLGLLQIGLNCP